MGSEPSSDRLELKNPNQISEGFKGEQIIHHPSPLNLEHEVSMVRPNTLIGLGNNPKEESEEFLACLKKQERFWRTKLETLMENPDANIEVVKDVQTQLREVQLQLLRMKFSKDTQNKELETEIIGLEDLMKIEHFVVKKPETEKKRKV